MPNYSPIVMDNLSDASYNAFVAGTDPSYCLQDNLTDLVAKIDSSGNYERNEFFPFKPTTDESGLVNKVVIFPSTITNVANANIIHNQFSSTTIENLLIKDTPTILSGANATTALFAAASSVECSPNTVTTSEKTPIIFPVKQANKKQVSNPKGIEI